MDGQHLLDKAPGVSLCVKLGFPGDKLVTEKVAGSHLDLVDYIIQAYHLGKIAPAPEVIKQPDSQSFAFCDRCGRWTRCPAKLRKLKEECPGSVESGAKKDNWAVHCLRLLRAGVAPGPGAKLPAEARLRRGRPKPA